LGCPRTHYQNHIPTFELTDVFKTHRREVIPLKIGYARVSSTDQNLDRQIDQLQQAGCEQILKEKITGMKKDRPELQRLLSILRQDDIIIISDLTRLSRSTKDLFALAEEIHKKGADIKSLKESWLDTTTAQGKLMFTIFAGISQFERDLISQRTKEGLAAARARGRKGGRPKKLAAKITLAVKMYGSKDYTVAQITETTGIGRSTFYRYLGNAGSA
jgi:DNA invertase Pin-like site-specific DNA recombinase